MDTAKTKRPLTVKNGAAALANGLWKGIVGMPQDKLNQFGNFISRVGFPVCLVLFAMYYFVPIINRVADGHLEYLRKTAESSVQQRADISKLIEVNTANNAVASETNRILQETSREHSELLHRIEHTLHAHSGMPATAELPTP